jgi:hypothetical protein
MEIIRSNTLAGMTINASSGLYSLTLYRIGNSFSDSIGEIIIDLPDYKIDTMSDAEIEVLYEFALHQYGVMQKLMDSEEI